MIKRAIGYPSANCFEHEKTILFFLFSNNYEEGPKRFTAQLMGSYIKVDLRTHDCISQAKCTDGKPVILFILLAPHTHG